MILASIADMKNGVLLVDEIENGFHYSSLSVLWKAIFKACQEYDVQLFATTHSFECIEAFSQIHQEENPQEDDIRLYRIDRKENIHKAFAYSASVLHTGLEREFEVR